MGLAPLATTSAGGPAHAKDGGFHHSKETVIPFEGRGAALRPQ
jgi:hypothetical protein